MGGLGIPNLADRVGLLQLKHLVAIADSTDPFKVSIAAHDDLKRRIDNLSKLLKVPVPSTLAAVNERKRSIQLRWKSAWSKLPSQGKGAGCFSDSYSNYPLQWREGRHSPADQRAFCLIRCNAFPTREVLHRADSSMDPTCRRCGKGVETNAHLLSACEREKGNITARHNDLLNFIAGLVPKRMIAFREKRVNLEGTHYYPDLVVVDRSRDTVHVVDVACPYEARDSTLRDIRDAKIAKYAPILDHLAETNECTRATVDAVVVGARGSWLETNMECLRRIGVTRNIAREACTRVLRRSLQILRKSTESHLRHFRTPKGKAAETGRDKRSTVVASSMVPYANVEPVSGRRSTSVDHRPSGNRSSRAMFAGADSNNRKPERVVFRDTLPKLMEVEVAPSWPSIYHWLGSPVHYPLATSFLTANAAPLNRGRANSQHQLGRHTSSYASHHPYPRQLEPMGVLACAGRQCVLSGAPVCGEAVCSLHLQCKQIHQHRGAGASSTGPADAPGSRAPRRAFTGRIIYRPFTPTDPPASRAPRLKLAPAGDL